MIDKILSGGLLSFIFACVAISVFLLIMLGYRVSSMVEEENRDYMDPLPPLLKLIWPFVQVFAYFLTSLYPYEYLERTERDLETSGVGYLMGAEQFCALRLVSAILFPVITLVCMAALNNDNMLWVLASVFLGYFFPVIWLSDTRKPDCRHQDAAGLSRFHYHVRRGGPESAGRAGPGH